MAILEWTSPLNKHDSSARQQLLARKFQIHHKKVSESHFVDVTQFIFTPLHWQSDEWIVDLTRIISATMIKFSISIFLHFRVQ